MTISYCSYLGEQEVTIEDEYGNKLLTGEKKVSYSEPKNLRAVLSSATGKLERSIFGTEGKYSHVLTVYDSGVDLSENDILFIRKKVEFNEDGVPKGDAVVASVSKSLNVTNYGINMVDVS